MVTRLKWNLFVIAFFAVSVSVQSQRRAQSGPTQSASQAQSSRQNPGSRGGPVTESRPPPFTSADDDDEITNKEADFSCPKSDGLFADPSNCRKFNLCGNWKAWLQTCPPSLYFDAKLKYCTFKTDSLTCGPIDEAEVRAEERELSQESLPVCNLNQCQLPNCFCTNDGTLIPGNIPPAQTPQIVLISFSGALNDLVFDHYRKILGYNSKFKSDQSRHNPNGCGIKATFFINHEYSNYAQIQWLAAQGHEIAVHSITHRQPEVWWTDTANYSNWAEEMIGMREILISNAGGTSANAVLTRDNIVGMRAPYIRPGGNAMFEMAHDFGLLYDSSIAAPRGSPPYWPFTYDFRQPFDCSNQPKKDQSKRAGPGDDDEEYTRFRSRPGIRQRRSIPSVETLTRLKRQTPYLGRPLKCPTKSFPGLWEVPINPLYNEFNTCHHADQCVFPSASDNDDIDAIVDFLTENFDRHYSTNRAPFQLNFHVTWFTQKRNVRALNKFLDQLLEKKDVWFTTFQEMINWIRDPKPTSETNFRCDVNNTVFTCSRPHTCVVKHYLNKDNSAASEDSFSRADTRYMPVCHSSLCPQQYQWYGNSAGRKHNFKTIMQLVEEAPVSASVTNEQPTSEN